MQRTQKQPILVFYTICPICSWAGSMEIEAYVSGRVMLLIEISAISGVV